MDPQSEIDNGNRGDNDKTPIYFKYTRLALPLNKNIIYLRFKY